MFDFTRRNFLKGLFAGTAFASFGGMRLFGADEKKIVVPKLRIGVVSDVHIKLTATTTNVWEKTLKWYDAQGVDVVLVAGDIADTAQLEQLKKFSATWYKVFPNDKGSDGRHVEKFFIQGNHDYIGWRYGATTDEMRKERFESSIMKDIKASWDECFHEEWQGIYKKVVKGYTFIGANWPHHTKIGEYMAKHKSEIDPNLPFFYTQHPHPKNTCYGPWAWGHDNGASTKTFTEFPNAIVFTGHSHNPLSDEAGIWQDSFTSIGTASLRYIGHRRGRANGGEPGPVELKSPGVGNSDQHGMLVSVFDDHINIKRRSFAYDESLGPDWTLPLPLGEKKPYAKAHRAQVARRKLPAFAEDAGSQIVVTEFKEGKGKLGPHIAVTFPSAVSGGMVFDYEIKAEIGDDHSEHEALGKPIYDVQPRRWTRRIFAPKYFMPLSKRPETATCFFGYTEIPIGESIRFAVTPMDAFGNRGKTIYSKVSKFTKPAAKAAEPAKPTEPAKPAAPAKAAEKPAAK